MKHALGQDPEAGAFDFWWQDWRPAVVAVDASVTAALVRRDADPSRRRPVRRMPVPAIPNQIVHHVRARGSAAVRVWFDHVRGHCRLVASPRRVRGHQLGLLHWGAARAGTGHRGHARRTTKRPWFDDALGAKRAQAWVLRRRQAKVLRQAPTAPDPGADTHGWRRHVGHRRLGGGGTGVCLHGARVAVWGRPARPRLPRRWR